MSEPLKELRSLSYAELVNRHDAHAEHTVVGTKYYLEEIARRDQDRQAQIMLKYTNQMRWMTVVVTIATVVNVAAFIWDLSTK